MVKSLRREVVSAVAFLWLAMGVACSDWPHFDYAPSPLRTVVEVEQPEGEQVQNLQELHGDVLVQGVIETSAYVPASNREAPFDLPGWYAGDMDWFQFSLRDPAAIRLQLGWEEGPNLLDLYFFRADSDTGELTILDYDSTENATSRDRVESGLSPGVLYVVGVAGHEGDGVSYELLILLED